MEKLPEFVTYKDKDYAATGKEGTNIATGKPVREFETYNEATGRLTGQRIWMADDGEVFED